MAQEGYPERIDPLNERANPAGSLPNLLKTHLERYRFAKRKVVGGTVLDVASGFGYGSSVIAENPMVGEVIGLDLSGEAVSYATEHYLRQRPQNANRIRFMKGDAEYLERMFGQRVFNNVVSFETIEHLECPERFLEGVRYVLRNDGVFMVSTPLKENSRMKSDGRPENPHHITEFTYREMMDLLYANGFAVEDVYFQEILLGPIAKRMKRDVETYHSPGRLNVNSVKKALVGIFNSTPVIPGIFSRPYRCPFAIGKTGRYGIYVARPKPYTTA